MIDQISSFTTPVARTVAVSAKDAEPEDVRRKSDTSRDTVEISEAGIKQINLARAGELARALPDATTDRAAFDEALKSAEEDVRRITELFSAVLDQLSAPPNFDQTDAEPGEDTETLTRSLEPGNLSDAQFAAALKKASADAQRITEIFADTLRTAFPHDYRI